MLVVRLCDRCLPTSSELEPEPCLRRGCTRFPPAGAGRQQQAQQRGFTVAIMRRGMDEGAATHNCMAVKLADPNKQVLHRNVEKEFILQQASHVRTTNPLLMYSLGVLVVVCCFCFHRLFRISRA